MISYDDVMKNDAVRAYIGKADESLNEIGYTEHSYAHVAVVALHADMLLSTLGFSARTVELARIAALLHDIGNLINRAEHAQSSAVMAFSLLHDMGMPASEIAEIVTAIGNHDEGTGMPVSNIAAALILADKSDVRRTRVRNNDFAKFDQHDRVNYSVSDATLQINEEHTCVDLILTIDETVCTPMDYFEIFMERMLMCRSAARKLGLRFGMVMNGTRMM